MHGYDDDDSKGSLEDLSKRFGLHSYTVQAPPHPMLFFRLIK